jgi:hypothetical protein
MAPSYEQQRLIGLATIERGKEPLNILHERRRRQLDPSRRGS